ncbi:hypothetical protein [Phyllobacterium lublinensis]|nr:hypothetical protein [Phyllobacterium sp. 2063]MBZ9655681.1 hypothetical protein [Phyllobacterium sp. 2063]
MILNMRDPSPSPENGDFSPYVRAYWPMAGIVDEGSWTPSVVERSK